MAQDLSKINNSMVLVKEWIEKNNYKGYEPFDGLSSILRPLTFKNQFLERVLQQVVRRSPINLRPILGIKPLDSTKGRGYIAQAYMNNWDIDKDSSNKDKAISCLNWLGENKSPFYNNYSWGNHFPVTFRGGHDPALEPIIVWTSLIGQAFLDGYERFKDENYLKVAEGAADYIIDDLPKEVEKCGICISYVSSQQRSIHNANMLGAAFLARLSKISHSSIALDLAESAMSYSCEHQLADGSWYYGEADKYHWIDNFHTGYNLDSLNCYIISTGDNKFTENLHRGLDFYINNFIEPTGRPKYYHNRTFPVDIQCAAQSIETLVNHSEMKPEIYSIAVKVANWTIDNMQHKNGYFFYRILPSMKIKTPMLHWGQATMYKALSMLLKVENQSFREI